MFQKVFAAVFALAIAGMAMAGPAVAVPLRYEYTGNNFEEFSGVYDGTLNVSGYFILDAALAANLDTVKINSDIKYFSFMDGINTITLDNTTEYGIFVSTDGLGQITDWRVDLQKFNRDNPDLLYNIGIITCLNMKEICGDFASTGSGGETFGDLGVARVSEASHGTWTVSPVPLPAALPLFASGLGAIGLLAWRRKRNPPSVTFR